MVKKIFKILIDEQPPLQNDSVGVKVIGEYSLNNSLNKNNSMNANTSKANFEQKMANNDSTDII